jgi:uncharacterized protein
MRLFMLTMLMTLTTLASAFAMDLVTAKAQGLVGETPQGYIEIVTPPGDTEVQALVAIVNDGRKKIYAENATKQGVKLEQVEAVAGASLIEKTPAGQFVKLPDGRWIKR